MIDDMTLRGEVRAVVVNGDIPFGHAPAILEGDLAYPIVSDQRWTNLVTNNGRAQMTQLIVGETTSIIRAIGLSTTAVSPVAGDVSLPNEIIRGLTSVAQSYLSYTQRYVAVFTTVSFGSTGIVGEGLFDTATTGGIMWAESSISVSKSTTQTLIVDHRITATT